MQYFQTPPEWDVAQHAIVLIRRFNIAKQGGGLMRTFCTSPYDDVLSQHHAFALRSLGLAYLDCLR